jgi:hypothetical protein
MAWAIDEDSGKTMCLWWRYRHHTQARQLTGRVSIRKSKLRAVIAYDVRTQAGDQGAEVESFLLVASDEGLETVHLTTAGGLPPSEPQFKTWQELEIEPGSATVLCVEAEDDHSNVMLSNRAWELVVFRHELAPPEALDSPDSRVFYHSISRGLASTIHEPDVFDVRRAPASATGRSHLSRLGLGNINRFINRFMGSEPSADRPRAIMCTRVAPTAGGRRTAGLGRSLISVTVLSQDDVCVWRLAFVGKDRWDEGFLRIETGATRERATLGGAAQDGSFGGVAASPQLKQNAPSKLLEMCIQPCLSSNGKWTDACVHVLAQHPDGTHYVHFLSPGDLELLRAPQRLPILPKVDAESAGAAGGGGELRMLPCTVTVDGREACNVHVTHGNQVLSIRTRAHENDEGANEEEDDDWHVGPQGQAVAAAAPLWGDRTRMTHLMLLTSEAVYALMPTNLEARAQGMGHSERLQSALKRAVKADDLYKYLNMTVQQDQQSAMSQLYQRNLRETDDHKRSLLCVLLSNIESEVLDAPVDARQGSRAESMSEKKMLEIDLVQKESVLKVIQKELRLLIAEDQGVSEALDRLIDRVSACKALLQHPSLVPGGTSVLAQAIQLTVNRKDWQGENALRPWAVAWRCFGQKCSKVTDVLLGLITYLEQLQAKILKSTLHTVFTQHKH